MAITLGTRPLKKSGIFVPSDYRPKTKKTRTIWTPDGEYDVYFHENPNRKRHTVLRGWIKDIEIRDGDGRVLVRDPVGCENTITNGAAFDILAWCFGLAARPVQGVTAGWGADAPYGANNAYSSNAGPGVEGNAYYDGQFYFPNLNDILSFYSTNTYWAPITLWFLELSLFGMVWLLNGVSGLNGSHVASCTPGAAFYANYGSNSYPQYMYGWYSSYILPTTSWPGTAYITMSDSIGIGGSGAPFVQHSVSITSQSSAQTFSFQGVAWAPMGYNTAASAGSVASLSPCYYSGGRTPTFFAPSFAVATTTPSTINNMMLSTLALLGYTVQMAPGNSFNFTYTFQG